ncbi:hypothetical protein MUTS16_18600 [Escherichia coli]|nr:hypothetical protein MUTS16_18600 [Escherichia coli]
MSVRNIFADESHDIYTVRTHADGPDGELPLTAEMLINRPSGDLFGMTMNAGMGWCSGRAGSGRYFTAQYTRWLTRRRR